MKDTRIGGARKKEVPGAVDRAGKGGMKKPGVDKEKAAARQARVAEVRKGREEKVKANTEARQARVEKAKGAVEARKKAVAERRPVSKAAPTATARPAERRPATEASKRQAPARRPAPSTAGPTRSLGLPGYNPGFPLA